MNKTTLIILLIVSFAAGIVVGVTVLRSNTTELGQVLPPPPPQTSDNLITSFVAGGCTYEWVATGGYWTCFANGERVYPKDFWRLWEGNVAAGDLAQ